MTKFSYQKQSAKPIKCRAAILAAYDYMHSKLQRN